MSRKLLKNTKNNMEDLKDALKELHDHVDNTISDITEVKTQIIAYFSDNIQMDESPSGALVRNQLKKSLLDFANSPTDWKFLIAILNSR